MLYCRITTSVQTNLAALQAVFVYFFFPRPVRAHQGRELKRNWIKCSGRVSLKNQVKNSSQICKELVKPFGVFVMMQKYEGKIFPEGLDKRRYMFIVKELNNSINWSGIRRVSPQFSKSVMNWLSCYYFTYSMPYVTLISYFSPISSGQKPTQEITSTADTNWHSCLPSIFKALIF